MKQFSINVQNRLEKNIHLILDIEGNLNETREREKNKHRMRKNAHKIRHGLYV